MRINVTERAQNELNEILAQKDTTGKSLRLYIAGYGWGGPSFGIALDEQNDNDLKDTAGGLDFIVDKELTERYGEFNVDYVDDWLRKGFSISADGSTGGC